jgi:hypothetical protein
LGCQAGVWSNGLAPLAREALIAVLHVEELVIGEREVGDLPSVKQCRSCSSDRSQ